MEPTHNISTETYVIFFGADGIAYFSLESNNYHNGAKIHCRVKDAWEAQKICNKLNLNQLKPTNQ